MASEVGGSGRGFDGFPIGRVGPKYGGHRDGDGHRYEHDRDGHQRDDAPQWHAEQQRYGADRDGHQWNDAGHGRFGHGEQPQIPQLDRHHDEPGHHGNGHEYGHDWNRHQQHRHHHPLAEAVASAWYWSPASCH